MFFSFFRSVFLFLFILTLCTGCQNSTLVVSGINEREANEIIVLLASKGISGQKTVSTASSPGSAQGAAKWNIMVGENQAVDAMALLNQSGLPRLKGTNLLDLFSQQGIMSSDKESTIRYQAGLSEQIASTIRKIDGIIDADVQISFPNTDNNSSLPWEQNAPQKITAAVYIKHQGILDDPNSHLIMKIKRLVSGSIQGLDLNDVTIISDRSRFMDITFGASLDMLSLGEREKEYVNIWSIVMSKSSASRFRVLFFFLSFCAILFAVLTAWLSWKLYPILKNQGGLKKIFLPSPLSFETPKPPVINEQTPPPATPEEKPTS